MLAFSFAKREFHERYLGTGLGQIWYILSPLVMIFIYTVIFSDFMKMKLNMIDSSYSYSIYLVPGILAWISFSTILNRLRNIFAQKSNLLKKINVPAYTFLLSVVIIEFCILLISYTFGIIFLFLVDHDVTVNFFILLPVLCLQTLFAFSLGTIIALLTVFFEDLKEALPIVIQLWFWMTPIIYMKEMIADKYPLILILNPFYQFVHIYQDIFLYSKLPSLQSIMVILTLTLVTLFLAAYLYKKTISIIKDII